MAMSYGRQKKVDIVSRQPYKCLLSKDEIIELRYVGLSLREIAKKAGVSNTTIFAYLNPGYSTRRFRKYYRRLKGEKREKHITDCRIRERRFQKKSLKLNPKNAFGKVSWKAKEISYIEEHIKDKTILEIAIDLKRTYHSVKSTIRQLRIDSSLNSNLHR